MKQTKCVLVISSLFILFQCLLRMFLSYFICYGYHFTFLLTFFRPILEFVCFLIIMKWCTIFREILLKCAYIIPCLQK